MIDLGKKYDGPTEACLPKADEAPSVSYPGVWLTFQSEDPDIPESGTITFSFRRTGKTVRAKKDKNPGCIEYDLELRAIEEMKEGSKKMKSADEALDEMVSEIEDD